MVRLAGRTSAMEQRQLNGVGYESGSPPIVSRSAATTDWARRRRCRTRHHRPDHTSGLASIMSAHEQSLLTLVILGGVTRLGRPVGFGGWLESALPSVLGAAPAVGAAV